MEVKRRNTLQKSTLWEILESAGRPLSVDELLEYGVQRLPSLNPSTVYRIVRRWRDDGRVMPVVIANRGTFYEPTEVAERHHHHFFCTKCEQLFDLPGCAAGLASLLPEGFELHAHAITLDGICADCANA